MMPTEPPSDASHRGEKIMKQNIGLGTAIAGIAAVLTLGIVAPASAGQGNRQHDSEQSHRDEVRAHSAASRRRLELARLRSRRANSAWNHNGSTGGHRDWNGSHDNRTGNSGGHNSGWQHDQSNGNRNRNQQNGHSNNGLHLGNDRQQQDLQRERKLDREQRNQNRKQDKQDRKQ
jgi:hypothetical protein